MALRLDTRINVTPEMRQVALRVGLCALILLAAAYVLVIMPVLEARKLDAEIAAAQLQMERRQALMPALSSLTAGASNATIEELVPAKREPIPRAQAYLITEQLAHMATAVGMEPLDITLNTASMAEDASSIQAQGVFTGQMDPARALLLNICRMPSLSRLERVEIRAVDKRLEMMVLMRVALGN